MLFSRAPVADPFGKCTEPLETQVPEQVRDAIVALGQMEAPRAKTRSEYLRALIEEFLYGKLIVAQALMRRPASPPADPMGPALDDAITALAVMAGMKRDEYIRETMARVVFGEVSMSRTMGHGFANMKQGNAG